MIPTPYLFFNGTAADALDAYAEILGGEVEARMLMGDGPPEMGVPEERKAWIMHATLKVGEGQIFLSDDWTASAPAMDGSSVMMEFDTAAEARRVFEALCDGGEARMPFEPTFWSAGFGTLTDRFGIRWMIGTSEQPEG